MTDHPTEATAVPARRRRFTGRGRALVSLAAVAVLATGFSVKGTFAFWTDSANLSTGQFTSGTLDITLNGALAGAANNGGTTTPAGFVLTNMVPSESLAFAFPVANAGSVPLTYTMSGTATGLLAPAMQFSVYGAAPTNAATNNTAANGLRTGTCAGTLIGGADRVLGAAAESFIAAGSPRSMATTGTTATENFCIVARLSSAAANSTQGQTMAANFLFDAKQVGAP